MSLRDRPGELALGGPRLSSIRTDVTDCVRRRSAKMDVGVDPRGWVPASAITPDRVA